MTKETVTRTVWTVNRPDEIHCVNCGLTWDMHLADGHSSCPTNRLQGLQGECPIGDYKRAEATVPKGSRSESPAPILPSSKEVVLHAWLRDAERLIENGVATELIAVCPVALATFCREQLQMRSDETKARLTDAQCDEVIDQLQEIEWSGITRDDVRTWDGIIAEARCSSPVEPRETTMPHLLDKFNERVSDARLEHLIRIAEMDCRKTSILLKDGGYSEGNIPAAQLRALTELRQRRADETSSDDAREAARYRFIRQRMTEKGEVTYYSMPHSLMFLRGVCGETAFDREVDARINGAAFESMPPLEPSAPLVAKSKQCTSGGPMPRCCLHILHVDYCPECQRHLKQLRAENGGMRRGHEAISKALGPYDDNGRYLKEMPPEEPKAECNHPRSELLVRKGNQFEMHKCLDCQKIFRVRLPEKSPVKAVCGKPMPHGKGAGQCINVPGHEGECDDMPF